MALTDNSISLDSERHIVWNTLPPTNKKHGFLSSSKERRIAAIASGLFAIFSCVCTYGAATRFTAKPIIVIRVTLSLAITTFGSVITLAYILLRKPSLDDPDICRKKRLELMGNIESKTFQELEAIDERLLSREEKEICLCNQAENLTFVQFISKHTIDAISYLNKENKSILKQKYLKEFATTFTLNKLQEYSEAINNLTISEEEFEDCKLNIAQRQCGRDVHSEIMYEQLIQQNGRMVIEIIAQTRNSSKESQVAFANLQNAFLQLPLSTQNRFSDHQIILKITPEKQKKKLENKWQNKNFSEILEEQDFEASLEGKNPLFSAHKWKLQALKFIEGKSILFTAKIHPCLFSKKILVASDRLSNDVTLKGWLLQELYTAKSKLTEIPRILFENDILDGKDPYVQEQVLQFVLSHLSNYVENSWENKLEMETYQYIVQLSLILPAHKEKIEKAKMDYQQSVQSCNEEIRRLDIHLKTEVEKAAFSYESKKAQLKISLEIDALHLELNKKKTELKKQVSKSNVLNRKLDALNTNLNSLYKEINQLKIQLQNASEQNYDIRQLERIRDEKVAQRTGLEKKLNGARSKKDKKSQGFDSKIKSLKENKERICEEINSIKNKINEGTKEQDQLSEFKTDVEKKQREIELLKEDNKRLKEELSKEDQVVTGFSNALSAQREKKKKEARVKSNDSSIQNMFNEIKALNEKIQAIVTNPIIPEKSDNLVQLEEELEKIDTQLNFQIKLKGLSEENATFISVTRTIEQEENKLESIGREVAKADRELNQAKTQQQRKENLENRLQELEIKQLNLSKEINLTKDDLEYLQMQLANRNLVISRIESQLNQAQNNFEKQDSVYRKEFESSKLAIEGSFKSREERIRVQLLREKASIQEKLQTSIQSNIYL